MTCPAAENMAAGDRKQGGATCEKALLKWTDMSAIAHAPADYAVSVIKEKGGPRCHTKVSHNYHANIHIYKEPIYSYTRTLHTIHTTRDGCLAWENPPQSRPLNACFRVRV